MKFNKILTILVTFLISLAVNAGALTDYAENKLDDLLFRGQAFSESSPATYYVSLETSACSDSSAGTEVTGGSYARVGVTRGLSGWTGTHGSITGASSGTNGTVANANAVTFPTPTANWGTVTYWGIWDASTSGHMIVCSALTSSRNITSGSTPSFGAGSLTFQIDN